jgi:hypothetical protein
MPVRQLAHLYSMLIGLEQALGCLFADFMSSGRGVFRRLHDLAADEVAQVDVVDNDNRAYPTDHRRHTTALAVDHARGKGYGFIVPDEGTKDLFVHHSNSAGDGYKSVAEALGSRSRRARARRVPRRPTSLRSRSACV